jgi:hypothetical protein
MQPRADLARPRLGARRLDLLAQKLRAAGAASSRRDTKKFRSVDCAALFRDTACSS